MYPELYSRKTPSTQYSFHYVLQNHYFVPYFRSPVWDRLLLGGKSLKGLKATAHRVLPSKPFVEAVLRWLHTVLRHGMLTGERISRVGCEGAPGPPPPCRNRGLLQGLFVFFLAPVCIQAASTPRVRVNTSAGSIYFHCLHSVKEINLFIQTHTEKNGWLMPAPGLVSLGSHAENFHTPNVVYFASATINNSCSLSGNDKNNTNDDCQKRRDIQ